MVSDASTKSMIRDMRKEAERSIGTICRQSIDSFIEFTELNPKASKNTLSKVAKVAQQDMRNAAKPVAQLMRVIAIGEAVAKDRGLHIPVWRKRSIVTNVLDDLGLTSEYQITIRPRELKSFNHLVTDADVIHARGLGIRLE